MKSLVLLLLFCVSIANAQTTDSVLQRHIEALVEGFEGDVGVYVRHLATGQEAAVRADDVFPTASMVKIPLLIGTFAAIERGELEWEQTLVYRDSLLYPGVDVLGGFRDSATVALNKVAMLMMTTSDNTASLWLQHLAGTGTAINAWLEANGYTHTRVNSRTPGREPNRQQFGWGQTSPREMAHLVTQIRNGEVVSESASQQMYRVMTRNFWDGEALSQLPPWVQAASKNGAVSRSKSEVVLVNAPSGDYVFCIVTNNQTDTRWEDDNAGYVLLRRLSALLWQYFEPESTWIPPLLRN